MTSHQLIPITIICMYAMQCSWCKNCFSNLSLSHVLIIPTTPLRCVCWAFQFTVVNGPFSHKSDTDTGTLTPSRGSWAFEFIHAHVWFKHMYSKGCWKLHLIYTFMLLTEVSTNKCNAPTLICDLFHLNWNHINWKTHKRKQERVQLKWCP